MIEITNCTLGPFQCLRSYENVTVFKKFHANSGDEQPHITCLLCYKHVITDMGYQIFENCTNFNTVFLIFFSCKVQKIPRLPW